MSVHIRRDGGKLCRPDKIMQRFFKNEPHISFTEAHRIDFCKVPRYCKECVEAYYKILDRANYIIVDGKPQKQ